MKTTTLNRSLRRRSSHHKRRSFLGGWQSLSEARFGRRLRVEQLEDRRVLAVFSNPAAITINDNAVAAPYPSTINVATPNVTASIVDVNATLTNISHTFPDDIGALLVSPSGAKVRLMADVGSGADILNVTLTFDDEAAGGLPDDAQIVSGSFDPTTGVILGPSNATPANFPAPAPASPYSGVMSAFDGVSASGTWNLFVLDDTVGDSGSIAAGWSLNIQLGGNVAISAGVAANNGVADNFNIVYTATNLQVTVNGTLVFDEPHAGVTSLTILGSSDVDNVTIDGNDILTDIPISMGGAVGNDTLDIDDLRIEGAPGDAFTADSFSSVDIFSSTFSNNLAGDGIHLTNNGAVVFNQVTASGNDPGVFVSGAASFSDTDGVFSNNNDHGIQLIDIAGNVTLVRTIADNNDADNDGTAGDGLNATASLNPTAIGGNLLIQGGRFRDSGGAGDHQERGVFVASIAGSVTMESSGGTAMAVTGNEQDGVRIVDGGTTATFTGGSYSNNGGDGLEIDSFSGAVSFSGGLQANSNTDDGIDLSGAASLSVTSAVGASNNGDDGLEANSITGAVAISTSAFNDNGQINPTGDGIELVTIGGAVTLNAVLAGGNDPGVFVNGAASYSDTGGIYNGNDNHGIQLLNITGAVTLTNVTAQENDADENGTGDGVNMDNIGGPVVILGGTYSDPDVDADDQQNGIVVTDTVGVGTARVFIGNDGATISAVAASGNVDDGIDLDDVLSASLDTVTANNNGNFGFEISNVGASYGVILSDLTLAGNTTAGGDINTAPALTYNTNKAATGTVADTVVVTTSTIQRTVPAQQIINYAALGSMQILTALGNDTIDVQGTGTVGPGLNSFVGGAGNDTITVAGSNLAAQVHGVFGDSRNDVLVANTTGAVIIGSIITPSAAEGNDEFILNVTANITATVLEINGNGNAPAGVANSANRDRLTINNAGLVSALTFDWSIAGAFDTRITGFAIAVDIIDTETVQYEDTVGNNTDVTLIGQSVGDDEITVAPVSANSAVAFIGGDPFEDTSELPFGANLPGFAGGGVEADFSFDGLDPSSIFVDGNGSTGPIGDQLFIYGQTQNGIIDPVASAAAYTIFNNLAGYGAGELLNAVGAGNAFDDIDVSTGLVQVNNFVDVAFLEADFVQDDPLLTSGLIVNSGDEPTFDPLGVVDPECDGLRADAITVDLSPVIPITVNGGLPPNNGVNERGDKLVVADFFETINVWSNKATPPTVTFEFIPFGGGTLQPLRQSSIECMGTLFAATVNLIGDNNDPLVDQTDNFVVVGQDTDSGDGVPFPPFIGDPEGTNEFVLFINGSIGFEFSGVQFLNAFGFDQRPVGGLDDDPATVPTADDIDTLELTAYADNGNSGGHPPRGWGIDVFFDEGVPNQADGDQQDLIIYHTSAGLGGGGSVSEDIVIQPSGPDNGEIRATNAVDGSVIVVVQYVANTDIIVLDDDGSLSDTDRLTLNGTNPGGPQTSGRDTIAANFTAAGTLLDPMVTVTDTNSALILYRLRNFVGFNTITLNPLAGSDTVNVTNRPGLTVNANGGDPVAESEFGPADVLQVLVQFSAQVSQGTDASTGLISTFTAGPIDYRNFERVNIDTRDERSSIVIQATNDNDVISLAPPQPEASAFVTVNDGPVIGINTNGPDNFAAIFLHSLAGNDHIQVTPLINEQIIIDAGSPSASDTVIVTGTPNDDEIVYEPQTANSGVVSVTGFQDIVLRDVEHLTIDGLTTPFGGVLQDALTITGNANFNRFVHTPGAALDEGHVAIFDLTANVTLLGVSYEGLGLAGEVEIYGGGNGPDFDTLVALGTGGSDSMSAGFLALNEIRIALQSDVGFHIPVFTEDVENYILDTLEGDDEILLFAPLSISGNFQVFGGGPGSSDNLLLFGSPTVAESVTISPDFNNPLGEQDVQGLGAPLEVSGFELIRYTGALSAAGAPDDTLRLFPGNQDDVMRVSHAAGSFDHVTSNVLPDIEFGELETFQIDMGGIGALQARFQTRFLGGALAANYQVVNSFFEDTLVIEGLDGGGGVPANDSFTVTHPTGADVAIVDNGPGVTVTDVTGGDTLGRLVLETRGGDDEVTVNIGGTLPIAVPITFDGGAGADQLVVIGTPLNVAGAPDPFDNVNYTPGPIGNLGRLEYLDGGLREMLIDFVNLEPVLDLVPAAILTVNGTNANNAINYTGGGTVANGLVSVDAFETIEFSNKVRLILNGLAGSDAINLNNPNTPTGLIGITVNGGDPTASDTVVVNGTVGVDTIVFTPTAPDAGTVLVNALPLIILATTEHLTINGRGGNDTLNTVTPAAVSSQIEITPGAAPDSGGLRVDSLIPLSFTNLGAAASLTITDPDVDRDLVIYNGTAADDIFRVPDSGGIPAPSLELVSHLGVGTTGIETYVLRGLSGDDRFEVVAQTNVTVDVQGGDPGASDVLAFTSTGATTLNLGSSRIDDAGVVGTPDVVYSGVEIININASGQALSLVGSASDDDLTVTVLTATSGKIQIGLAVQQSGQVGPGVVPPLVNYSSIVGALAVDMLAGEDTLVVVGNAFAQNWLVNAAAGSVAIDDVPNGVGNDGLVTFINTESLETFGLEGNDTFIVTAGAIPVFVDGGDPIGTLPGDLIFPIGAIAAFPGPESDEGGFLTGPGGTISFDHIESIIVPPNGDDCPFLILGTNADDDITVVARNEITINLTTFFPGADGIQDFTVSVNAGPDILFLDEPDLFIDALNGDDDIVVRTPAPNDADWDVNVRVAGGPPSIGETNEADRLVLETPGVDLVEFRPTGPDTGRLVINEDGVADYQAGGTDSIITFGPFVFECVVDEEIIFTYLSSPGGVELVEYDGEDSEADATIVDNPDDRLTIFGTAGDDTTTVAPAGLGSGTFISTLSPVFSFRSFEELVVNGGSAAADAAGAGFDHVIYNATQGPDAITSDSDTLFLADPNLGLAHLVTLGASIDKLDVNTFGGNDNIDLDITVGAIAKTIDAGAGNDTVNLLGSDDADIFGGIGDDTLIGSPVADNIFGGAGNDILIGGGGVDNEFGEDGNDLFGNLTLTPNGVADDPGADFMFGGDGIDQFVWEPGDGSDNISGGVDGADILRFFGDAGANAFLLNPAAVAPTHMNTTLGGATVDTHGVEQLIVSGLAGADTFTVTDLTPTEVEDLLLVVDAAAGSADAVTVNGRTVSDNVNITVNANGPAGASRVNIAGLDYDIDIDGIALADADTLTFNGNEGNDTILSDNDLNPLDLSLLFSSAEVTINAGLGDDFVSGFGTLNGNEGNDTLVGGSVAQTINGGDGNDQIFGGGGADLLNGNAGEDTFVPGFDGAVDTVDGGADFDTILVQGNSANNRIDAIQTTPTQVQYEISGIGGGDGIVGGAGTESDTLVIATVEQLTILAGSGDDVIRVAHADALVAAGVAVNLLRFTVDGGLPGASDRLTVTDLGLGDTTVQRIGGTPGDGSFTMYAFLGGVPAAGIIPLPPVVYTDVEFASLNPVLPITGGTGGDGNGKLFVFKHDPFEQNNSRLNATFLGANETTNVDPTIDPGADPIGGPGFGLPGDEDWYRIVAQHNGTLDIQVYFDQQGTLLNGRAGLPAEGNLEIALYDADGLVGAAPVPGEIAGTGLFGLNDTNDDERIRIPAVAGQTYYLRVLGAPFVGNIENSSAAINVYNVAVVNTPAEVPIDLELDDVIGVASVDAVPAPTPTQFDATSTGPQFVLSTLNDFYNGKDIVFTSGNLNGIRGRILDYIGATQTFQFLPGTFFAAPTAGSTFQIESADTGRSQFDNITRDTTPTIFLRVPNVVNVAGVATLDDLPYNGSAPGDPPDQFIGIPHISSVLLDVPIASGAGFRVPIFITEHGTSDQGPPNNVLAGYAQPVDPINRPGLFSFTFGSAGSFIPELPVFPATSETTSFFISARVEMIDPAQNINPVAPHGPDNQEQAQGYGAFAESLEIVVDTQPPPVFFGLPNDPDDGLLPDSDTGVNTNPETLNDSITSDTTPGFFGQAEADAVIRLFIDAPQLPLFPTGNGIFEPAIDFQIGFDVAEPFDGTNQYPNGYWQVDAVNVDLNAPPFSPTDGLRRIFVTAEDVAGNINPEQGQIVQELEIFIDTQGPQITDVEINNKGNPYDLFDPKPSTDGPTPLVNSIFLSIQDLPLRVAPFLIRAIKEDIADNPGHYLVTGDYNGIIPILDIVVTNNPVPNPAPEPGDSPFLATACIEIVFRRPGPDGVFNTSDDIGKPLPDDRFTLFVNAEGIIDLAGNIGDFESNADEPHDSPPPPGFPDVLGVDGVPTGDGIPGGDFLARFTVDSRPELGVWAAGSAFLDINGNTIWDPDNEDFTNRDITHVLGFVSDDLFAGRFATSDGEGGLIDDGFDKLAAYGRVGTTTMRWLIDTDNDGVADIEQLDPANINGLPVAGNFALGFAGDEVGLFTGSTWHFDTNHNFVVDTTIAWPTAGHAIVGDFDGDGRDDLATWTNDTFSFDLSSIGPAGPVAALNNPGLGTGVNGTIERTFRFGFAGPSERPVAADMNQDGIEDVGLWMPARDGITPRGQSEWYFLLSGVTQNDTGASIPANLGPTITGSNDPTPGSYLALPNGFYGLTNYTTGRIVVDPLFPGANIVRFQPVPFGNDQFMQFGDEFALPLVGNFDPPTTLSTTVANPSVNPRNPYDVNNDGTVNQIDLLNLVNWLTVNGPGPAPSGGFVTAPYVDVNDDTIVNSIDLLALVNYITLNPPGSSQSAGEGEAEGEGGGGVDDFFSRLGSGGGGSSDEDDLLDLIAQR
ncbi:MAG: hypothetical protein L0211_17105 [Planctomycetaceae bacterium]|nr:hypothetical protein [Planctomycetaceae bacterium]